MKNKTSNGLTVEKLKTYKGFENVSEEEAEEIITAYRKFSQLTFKYFEYVRKAVNVKKEK